MDRICPYRCHLLSWEERKSISDRAFILPDCANKQSHRQEQLPKEKEDMPVPTISTYTLDYDAVKGAEYNIKVFESMK